MSSTLTPDEARDVLARTIAALKKAGADDGLVNLSGGTGRDMRFALNGITTNGSVRQMKLEIHASVGSRTASVESNRLDSESIARVAAEVVANARVLPENREHMPTLGPQTYDEVAAWFRETAEMEPVQLAGMAGSVITEARANKVSVAGFAAAGDWLQAVASFNGVDTHQQFSRVKLTATARTPEGTGSGWANSVARRMSQFSADDVTEGAIRRAVQSRNPEALKPGTYPVILEPQAVANIIRTLRWRMDARSADEGRSFFSQPGGKNKIGTRIWDTPISLRTDPNDPRTSSAPFDDEGLPQRRVTWVENGTLERLPTSRYWANKNGQAPLAWPRSWLLEGSGKPTSLKEMIASAERAILITRLWYIRSIDQRRLLVTGLTRDGTFLVENGMITKALKNFRFNESPIEVLQHATQFSTPQTVATGVAVPALSVSQFRFTSVSDAI